MHINIEKGLMFAMLAFTVWSGVYLNLLQEAPDAYDVPTVTGSVPLRPDFDIGAVIDNTPFVAYYAAEKRNPFVPYHPPAAAPAAGGPSVVDRIKEGFDFPGRPKETAPSVPEVALVDLPAKPGDDPAERIDPDTARRDESLPVYLVGFAKTFGEADTDRKAILAHKQSGEVYTVRQGDAILGMHVAQITPYSIIIILANGRKVEFLHDILKAP